MSSEQAANPSVDEGFMQRALELAERAAEMGEVPVGAVVVLDGEVIGEGWNQPITACDPTAHAEIMALRAAAARIGNYRLVEADLYVTLEPCSMCAGAIVHSRIRRLVYGATEPKAGVAESQKAFFSEPWLNHQTQVCAGVLADTCSERLSEFFRKRRAQKKAQKAAQVNEPQR